MDDQSALFSTPGMPLELESIISVVTSSFDQLENGGTSFSADSVPIISV